MENTKKNVYIIVPNWNGKDTLPACLNSLRSQTLKAEIVVVDNGSTDGSLELLRKNYPEIKVQSQTKNLGFAGGVNIGIKAAIEADADYVALFNNDAVADKDWLKNLVALMDNQPKVGIVTCKLMDSRKSHLDSTGDFYTIWGLPYPRGRGEAVGDQYDQQTEIFAASGGASLYRVSMLKQIGLFDEKFFAYYEDVDLSFRAQLAGWKVRFEPLAIAYHQIGATSSKLKGFTTYQTMKNLPILLRKNLPLKLFPIVVPRFLLAYSSFFWSAVARGQFWPALKGFLMSVIYIPHTLKARYKIQKNRIVSADYINKMMVHDLPPNANKLRRLRSHWHKLFYKH